MVKVVDESVCNDDKTCTCYDCKYWRLVNPNCSGLIDVAVCARRLLDVYEDTNICVDFKEMDTIDRAVQNMVRRKMVEVTKELQESTKEYYKERLEEEVVDNILETIKWNIMRKVDR